MGTLPQVDGKNRPSLIGGTMIIAGSAIGAGLFALPVISAGMWFGWALVSMVLGWFFMYHAALLIMESTLHFHRGASFGTIVQKTLGKWPNVLNAFLVMFLLYVLEYAFISGGGSVVDKMVGGLTGSEPGQAISAIVFSLVFASVVLVGMKAVDRVTTVMFLGMLVTFIMVVGELGFVVDVSTLFDLEVDIDTGQQDTNGHWRFIFAALPSYLTSFGFYAVVPSLVKYYDRKPAVIMKAMLYGSVLCLALYLAWLIVTMGNLDRPGFLPVIAEGGNVGVLVGHILNAVQSDSLIISINIFANLALITSFLGVSLGLFDYFADMLGLGDNALDRLKCGLLVFLPPMLGGAFYPDGFVVAIGYAGLALALHGLILPAIVAYKARQMYPEAPFRVWGGNWLIAAMVLAGVFFSALHFMGMMDMLPEYG